jgi:predicted RNA-binding protein with EMAP domain
MAIKIEINKNIQNITSLKYESLNFQNTYSDPKLLEILDKIILSLKKDKNLKDEELKTALDDIKILLREIQLNKPRKGVINSIITTLGNFASIASLLDKVYPFLPKF